MKKIFFICLFVCIALLMQCEDALPQSINTIKQQCQSPFQSDYGSVKITSAGDVYITPCPGRSIFPPISGLVSPLTTKGDIWGWNTTNARIPVGANGQVLTANSAVALGVNWATPTNISGLTTNFVTKATSATTIGNSTIFDDGTAVSFGTLANGRLFWTANQLGAGLTGCTAGCWSIGGSSSTSPRYLYLNTLNTTNRLARIDADVLTGNRQFSLPDITGKFLLDTFVQPASAGSVAVGTNALPFSSIFIGTAATNNIQLTGATATAARTLVLPNTSGNLVAETGAVTAASIAVWTNSSPPILNQSGISVVGAYPNGTLQGAIAGNSDLGTSGDPFHHIFIGSAANLSTRLNSLATVNRNVDFPDADGTVLLQGGSGTISGLTATKVPVATSGTTLADSRIEDNGAGNSISIDSQGSNTVIGDVGGAGSGTVLTVDDTNNTIGVTSEFYTPVLDVGNFPLNQFSNISTFATAIRSVVFPDASGTVQLVGAANTGTIMTVPLANSTLANATGTVFTSPCTIAALTITTEGNVSCPITRNGTVRNLYVRTGGTAKVNTPTTTITMRKNGSNQTVTLTLTETVNTTTSDTTHNFTVTAGDLITISIAVAGAAAVSTSIAGITFEID